MAKQVQVVQRASLKNVPLSVKKLMVILEMVKGDPVELAIQKLRLVNKKGAYYARKLLISAVANVQNNKKMDTKDMKVLRIWATKAPSYKRYRFGAKGRIKPYKKHRANIFVEIGYGA